MITDPMELRAPRGRADHTVIMYRAVCHDLLYFCCEFGQKAEVLSRKRIKADRKKCVLIMLGKAFDVRCVSLKQRGDHGVA